MRLFGGYIQGSVRGWGVRLFGGYIQGSVRGWIERLFGGYIQGSVRGWKVRLFGGYTVLRIVSEDRESEAVCWIYFNGGRGGGGPDAISISAQCNSSSTP